MRPAPSQALLLAAGLGTRLRPLTDDLPKCMLPIGGRPLLEHTVSWLSRHGVRDLIVNLHHRPERIVEHFGDGAAWGVRITWSHEPEILGTAGTVRNAARHFEGSFYVWYADNLSTCRLDRLWRLHQAAGAMLTVALHRRADPTSSGIVAQAPDGRITRFLEKPRHDEVFSHWVSAGILVVEPDVVDAIPASGTPDLGRDVIPSLIERGDVVYGYRLSSDERLWWIDTPEDLDRVRAEWEGVSGR